MHELMMIKVAAKPEQRQGLISIADVSMRSCRRKCGFHDIGDDRQP